jgi:hypothetical protein
MDDIISGQTRIIIKACVTDIPGNPQGRFSLLGDLFYQEFLRRNLDILYQGSSYNYVHIPCGFDSDQPIRRYFIYDLNITGTLQKEELLQLPHLVYYVSRNNGKW